MTVQDGWEGQKMTEVGMRSGDIAGSGTNFQTCWLLSTNDLNWRHSAGHLPEEEEKEEASALIQDWFIKPHYAFKKTKARQKNLFWY